MLTNNFAPGILAANFNSASCPITSLYYTQNEFPSTLFLDPTQLDEIVIPLPKCGW